jgi:hypothetical protein
MIQLKNCWENLDEIRCEFCSIGVYYSKTVIVHWMGHSLLVGQTPNSGIKNRRANNSIATSVKKASETVKLLIFTS